MISSALVLKWKKMIHHQSVFHVNQAEGKYYSISDVKGYYNDLREKVFYTTNLDIDGIPYNFAALNEKKKKVYFVISIFQYGLGAYDIYLETDEKKYQKKMLTMADWAISQQAIDGSWNAFGILNYSCVYSSMAQGEGASLLARAYKETKDERYKKACVQAVDFMLKPIKEGGTCEYTDKGLVLQEYPDKSTVLNGWIFSAFGIFDCWKITKNKIYLYAWEQALCGIKNNLKKFDSGHWSYYDCGGKYASPFYHQLHIELLKVLNKLSGDIVFEQYIQRWEKVNDSKLWSKIAFLIKAKQKIIEKNKQEWVLVS